MLIGRTQRTYFLGLILAVALACGVAAGHSEAAPARDAAVSDARPPSVPQGMRFAGKTRNTISLVWRAASDDTAVAGYRLYRNGARVATVKTLRYVFRSLRCGRRYTIALEAYDAAGNASNRAEATGSIKTNACAATTAKKPPPKKPVKKKPSAAPAGPPPGTAHLWVDTNGGSCARRATPAAYSDGQACSWNGAYQAAQTGDFVGVRGGNYGDVKIGPNKTSIAAPGVTFRTAAGETVVVKDFENGVISGGRGASNVRFVGPARARTFRTDRTDNVVIDNWNVDCGGCVGEQIFHLEENNNVVVRNSEIQNNTDNSLMWINGTNLTFENNEIHGAHLRSGSGAHTECMYAWEVTRLTLKRNRFYDCAIMDVFITGGAVSNGGFVENNVFEKPEHRRSSPSTSATAATPPPTRTTGTSVTTPSSARSASRRREPRRPRWDARHRQPLPRRLSVRPRQRDLLLQRIRLRRVRLEQHRQQRGGLPGGLPLRRRPRQLRPARRQRAPRQGQPEQLPLRRPRRQQPSGGAAPDIGAYEFR